MAELRVKYNGTNILTDDLESDVKYRLACLDRLMEGNVDIQVIAGSEGKMTAVYGTASGGTNLTISHSLGVTPNIVAVINTATPSTTNNCTIGAVYIDGNAYRVIYQSSDYYGGTANVTVSSTSVTFTGSGTLASYSGTYKYIIAYHE